MPQFWLYISIGSGRSLKNYDLFLNHVLESFTILAAHFDGCHFVNRNIIVEFSALVFTGFALSWLAVSIPVAFR